MRWWELNYSSKTERPLHQVFDTSCSEPVKVLNTAGSKRNSYGNSHCQEFAKRRTKHLVSVRGWNLPYTNDQTDHALGLIAMIPKTTNYVRSGLCHDVFDIHRLASGPVARTIHHASMSAPEPLTDRSFSIAPPNP